MSDIVRKLDFNVKSVKEEFPNIVIADANVTTPLVVDLLEKGTMPVICVVGGKRKVVARVSESACNVSKILRTHSDVTFNQSLSNRVRLYTVKDYLEVL